MRLAEIQAVSPRIRLLDDPRERKAPAELEAQPLSALQENAFGTLVIQPFEAFEIASFETQIGIEGRAQCRGHIHRIVALDFAGDSGSDVDRVGGQRPGRGDDEEDETGHGGAAVALWCHQTSVRGVDHAGAREVRNDKSAARTPRRRVARDVSCRRP